MKIYITARSGCVCERVCVCACARERVRVASTPVDSRVSCGQSVNKYACISISLNQVLQGRHPT